MNGVIHIADFWDVRREPSALAEQVTMFAFENAKRKYKKHQL
jgi:hypothetical protein